MSRDVTFAVFVNSQLAISLLCFSLEIHFNSTGLMTAALAMLFLTCKIF